jgi:transcriptional regulator with PAS, ATPase and Fis domain
MVEISKTVIEVLESYEFPMNVRQLENVMIGALARSDPGKLILPKHLPKDILSPKINRPSQADFTINMPRSLGYKAARDYAVQAVDNLYLSELLRKHKGNHTRAAEEAGIDRKTFSERIEHASHDEEAT